VRILQLCNKAPFPANDGSSIAIYNMAVGLHKNGVYLDLMTLNTKKHFKSDKNVPKYFLENTHYLSVYKNTNPSVFGLIANLFSSKSYFETRFYFPEFEQKLIEKLQANRYDIIQLEGLFMSSYVPVIRQYSTAKIVLRAHNIEHVIWERHNKSVTNPIKKAYFTIQTRRLKKQELIAFQQVDYIVPISPIDENILGQWVDKSKMQTVLTGVDLAEYQLEKDPMFETKSVFCFGSMDWLPNQQAVEWFLEKCWPIVLDKIPSCKFIIAGRNIPESFKQKASVNVLILENVPTSNEIYNRYNVMVVPLQSGSGLRIKIVEGLSFGKAIVSTPIGCEGIDVQNNRDLLIAETPEKFADAVIELVENNERRNSIELNAKSFAKEHLDNIKLTATLVRFYNSILS
jgi:glycosyltransferase involved in cell wall biosynthesis